VYRTFGQLKLVPAHFAQYTQGTSPTYAANRFTFILRLMLPKKLILLALLATASAYASSLYLGQLDPNLGEFISFYDYGSNTTNWVGGVDAKVDDTYARVLYCVQLTVNIGVPGTYDSVLDYASTASLRRVGWLMQYHAPTNPIDGVGFQLALWDIIQDGADGFSTGNVRANGATPTDAVTAANNYETISQGQSSYEAIFYKNSLDGDPRQELIGFWPTDPGPRPQTPEPSAVILILSGLAFIGLSRLRRGARTN
jgi:hypothetical protein